MRIDRAKLESAVAAYLRSPEAEAVYDQFEIPLWISLPVTGVALTLGVALLPSLAGTPLGLRMIRFALRGRAFDRRGGRLRKDPDQLRPLIAHGIIVGPSGHALVLGSFDARTEADFAFLAARAAEFGALYADGPDDPAAAPLVEMLRQDAYTPGRRRRVPEPFAQGRELYLFDLKLDADEAAPIPDADARGTPAVLVACVATPGAAGLIAQVPWSVVAPAVRG